MALIYNVRSLRVLAREQIYEFRVWLENLSKMGEPPSAAFVHDTDTASHVYFVQSQSRAYRAVRKT